MSDHSKSGTHFVHYNNQSVPIVWRSCSEVKYISALLWKLHFMPRLESHQWRLRVSCKWFSVWLLLPPRMLQTPWLCHLASNQSRRENKFVKQTSSPINSYSQCLFPQSCRHTENNWQNLIPVERKKLPLCSPRSAKTPKVAWLMDTNILNSLKLVKAFSSHLCLNEIKCMWGILYVMNWW